MQKDDARRAGRARRLAPDHRRAARPAAVHRRQRVVRRPPDPPIRQDCAADGWSARSGSTRTATAFRGWLPARRSGIAAADAADGARRRDRRDRAGARGADGRDRRRASPPMAAPACSSTMAICNPPSATRCRRSRRIATRTCWTIPGEADLTAHVDFRGARGKRRARTGSTRISRRRASSCSAWGFWNAPGGSARVPTRRRAQRLQGEVERLAGPDAMGKLFKVLAIAPPGDSAAALRRLRLTCTPALPHCRAPERGSERQGAKRLDEPVPGNNKAAHVRQQQNRIRSAPRRSINCSQPASATAISRASAACRTASTRASTSAPGSHDDQAKVRENRRRVAAWMGVAPSTCCTAYQIHSPDVIVRQRAFRRRAPEGRRHRHRPAGHRHRRLDRRLRSGAVRRCRSPRDRRGPCRLERRL